MEPVITMKTVNIRNLTIGAGVPKICVPIVGRTREEVLEQAAAIRSLPADLVEWRFDCFYNVSTLSLLTVLTFLSELRRALGDLPLLFTFRTAAEGGEKKISHQVYEELNRTVLSSGMVDLLDVELSQGDELLARLMDLARDRGVKVILSSHDFEQTPPEDELVDRMERMQALGADIAKVAVTPQCEEDVDVLLRAAKRFTDTADIPAIAISMGELGTRSRIEGERYGSSVTFGAAIRASAPGQIDVAELRAALDEVHRSL